LEDLSLDGKAILRWSIYVRKEECVKGFGGKARRKETTRKT
jgi:hypothetical protein